MICAVKIRNKKNKNKKQETRNKNKKQETKTKIKIIKRTKQLKEATAFSSR